MARPRNDENRDRRITIRITETEYQLLSEEARRQSLTLADYVRHQALFGEIDVHYKIESSNDEIAEIRDELHHIGINLNQISRFLNTGGKAGNTIVQDVRKAISDIYDLGQELRNHVSK